jgi:hypothetical protein
MRDTMYDEMEPPVYPDEFWDPEQETVFWDAEPAETRFAEDGAWDRAPAGPVLAMSVIRTAEGDVSKLSNDELLGAISAGERVQGQAAWAANVLAAEYARRNLEIDEATGEETLGEFGADDYAQEILVAGSTAKRNLTRSLTLGHLPRCMELAHDGALTDYRQRIIAEETVLLDPVLLDTADELIAKDAAGRTPGSLRSRVRKIVMRLDPQQAEAKRKNGTRNRRVEFWEGESGNVTMAAREMSVGVAAAIKQALDGWARIMRAAGIEGSLDNLRHDAATALLLGRQPVSGAATPAGPVQPTNPFNPWEYPDYEPQMGSEEPPVPASPVVTINLMITAGTLDPRVNAPGFVPGFGNITAQAARDLIIAGSANQASRWCVTEVDPVTGYAVSHGCARGPHRWPGPGAGPPDGQPPGNGPPGNGPPGNGPPGRWPREPGAPPSQQVAEFIASLNVMTEPLATQPGDQGRTEPGHDPSRTLRHLIEARHATCATPGCDTPAVNCDMEHRIEYENNGPTSEGNLDPATHGHCHRVKQNNQWKVIKTGPRETIWAGPSGRTRTVRPTRHLL